MTNRQFAIVVGLLVCFGLVAWLIVSGTARAQIQIPATDVLMQSGDTLQDDADGGYGGGGASDCAVTNAAGECVAIDVDGDGIYSWARADHDWDGDGTAWHQCDCGSDTSPGVITTDNREQWICGNYIIASECLSGTAGDCSAGDGVAEWSECRFNSDRIWDDPSDDFNVLHASMDYGSTVEFPPGIYVHKGMSASGLLCWDSTTRTRTGTCPLQDGTTLGILMMDRDGMTMELGAPDGDAERDYKRTGTWLVEDSDRTQTISFVNLGRRNFGVNGQGAGIVRDNSQSHLVAMMKWTPTGPPDTPPLLGQLRAATMCVCNTANCVDNITGGNSDYIGAGATRADPILVGDDVYFDLQNVNGFRSMQAGTVIAIGSACGLELSSGIAGAGCNNGFPNCGMELHIGFDEHFGPLEVPIPWENRSDLQIAAVGGPLRKGWSPAGMTIHGGTMAVQDWWGSSEDCNFPHSSVADAMLNWEQACDTGNHLSINSGQNLVVEGTTFALSSGNGDAGRGFIDGSGLPNSVTIRDFVSLDHISGIWNDNNRRWAFYDGVFKRTRQNLANVSSAIIKTFGGGQRFERISVIEGAWGDSGSGGGSGQGNPSNTFLDLTDPYITVTDCSFEGVNGDAIAVGGLGHHMTVTNNKFIGVAGYQFTIKENAHDVIVSGNVFGLGGYDKFNNLSEFKVFAVNGAYESIIFQNNVVEGSPDPNNGDSCFIVAPPNQALANQLTLQGNTFDNIKPFCENNNAARPWINTVFGRYPNMFGNIRDGVWSAGLDQSIPDVFANLPICNSENYGRLEHVTNANPGCTTFASSNACVVRCDGNGTWSEYWN